MEWVWIRGYLRVAEWHLDLAMSTSVAHVVRMHLQHAQQAYAVAMTQVEHDGLNCEEQRELKQRMQELRIRLDTIEHRAR